MNEFSFLEIGKRYRVKMMENKDCDAGILEGTFTKDCGSFISFKENKLLWNFHIPTEHDSDDDSNYVDSDEIISCFEKQIFINKSRIIAMFEVYESEGEIK